MTTETKPFRVSVGLKDLIGRDLITDDFVAVFELVKNSFDAHATKVRLLFEADRIAIADNGKGMSRQGILDKWLLVAYSAKRDGSEDDDYRRTRSRRQHPFAGEKGIGRFSCDRLGKALMLSSRSGKGSVQIVTVDWTLYEETPKRDFATVKVNITEAARFPSVRPPSSASTGTVLEITGLRSEWPRKKLRKLRRDLAKLINPFESSQSKFQIEIDAPSESAEDRNDKDGPINGAVENTLLDVLKRKTTSISVRISKSDNSMETVLEDRGEVIYRTREPNSYKNLAGTPVRADIYYLNRSAKHTFALRMGLPSVEYGSLFLFRNGFHVFPIGEERDDFFGLLRRKQQGVRRYLGTRDVIGRVDVPGDTGFREATSRDQGLVQTPQVVALTKFVEEKCIRRLERYVVEIAWRDPEDQDREEPSRMSLDANRARIAELVRTLADAREVEIVDYNKDLVRIVDEKSEAFESSLSALEVVAERTDDAAMKRTMAKVRAQYREARAAAVEFLGDAEKADARAATAEQVSRRATRDFERERERNRFLVAAQSLDGDTILNLHHQIMVQASDVQIGVKRMMRRLRSGETVGNEEWVDFLGTVAFRNSQILTTARFATKGGYREQAVEAGQDLAGYIADYIQTVAALWAPRGIRVECMRGGGALRRVFRPIDVGIVIDNLVSNAAKANARRVLFVLQSRKKRSAGLKITVADDGDGWPAGLRPVERVFEKGTTTTNGSGLGLFHVRQVVEAMLGAVEATEEPYSQDLDGAQLTIRVGT